MPCDTRLLTFNEMLKLATEQLLASDKRTEECRARHERTTVNLQAAKKALDLAICDEARARQAYIDWLSYLHSQKDEHSAPMQEQLTRLYNSRTQAIQDTLLERETVGSFQKELDEATAALAVAEKAQGKIAEEKNLIESEIAKLSGLSRSIHCTQPSAKHSFDSR
jgi:hypothetical protein